VTDRSRLRLVVLRALILAVLLTLLGRLFDLQVEHGATFRREAASNGVRDLVTAPPRGQILDDTGRVLAGDRDALVVQVDRSRLLATPDGGRVVLARLAARLHEPLRQLETAITPCSRTFSKPGCWPGSPYQPIPVSDNASAASALQIIESSGQFPGVSVQPESVRTYPTLDHGVWIAHVLGYVGPISQAELNNLPPAERVAELNALVGRGGLEQQYNGALEGHYGIRQVSVDSLGNVIGTVKTTPPVPGDDVVTSINSAVQTDLVGALAYAVRTSRRLGVAGGGGPANAAAGVVMDAQTGRILAMSSWPSYNPNDFVGGISTRQYAALLHNPNDPLTNKAIDGVYLPGSTFKLITSSAILTSGQPPPDNCPPEVDFGGHIFHNDAYESLPGANLRQAIIISCDSFFYLAGEQEYLSDQHLISIGKKPRQIVARMAHAYGYGAPTGVDLPGEASGYAYTRAEITAIGRFYWRQECIGAHDRHHSAARRAADAALCRDGPIPYEPGDQLLMNIGQGEALGITPLQEAVAYSALVNGGKVFEPRIAEAIVSPSGRVVRRIVPPVRRRVPVPRADLAYIESAMYGVTQSASPTGTAYASFQGFPFHKVDVGGKTGTADYAVEAAPQSWFASFAGPAGKRPDLVSIITVHNGGYGTSSAGIATRQLWQHVFGLAGDRAALRRGYPPDGLPTFRSDGTVAPPAAAGSAAASTSAGGLPPALAADPARRRGRAARRGTTTGAGL
jgi:penicillin-binding protein 2